VNADVDYHNGQSHWHGHLPMNQVNNPDGLLPTLEQQQEPQLTMTSHRKKKGRGNRREQRFRRRVRHQNLEGTAEKRVVQSRIEKNTEITDNNTMEENQDDDNMVDMEEEQIQVSIDCCQRKKTSSMSLLCLLLIRNVLTTAPSSTEGSP
jgi:hypothetical protein